MYKEWLKTVDENWETIREKADWMCREVYEGSYPDNSKLTLIINNEGNVLSKLEDEINYTNEFSIISLDCKKIDEDEKTHIKRIEWYQENVIPDLLTMFREKLANKASHED